MLPTMVVLNKRHPDIFDNSWICFICNSDHEDFNHIWTCTSRTYVMLKLIDEAKTLLANDLQLEENYTLLEHLDIWSLSNSHAFNFVDLIKGLVPCNLYNFVHSHLMTKDSTMAAISNFMHFIFAQTHIIWLERCSALKEFEKSLDITDTSKRANTEASGYQFLSSHSQFSSTKFISKMIRFGSHWTNFWCSRDQALSFLWSVYWKVIM